MYHFIVTPEDYHPKHFRSANVFDLKFPLEPNELKLGTVTSKYHSIDLTVKTSYSTSSAEVRNINY